MADPCVASYEPLIQDDVRSRSFGKKLALLTLLVSVGSATIWTFSRGEYGVTSMSPAISMAISSPLQLLQHRVLPAPTRPVMPEHHQAGAESAAPLVVLRKRKSPVGARMKQMKEWLKDQDVERKVALDPLDAISFVKECASAGFDETIEVAARLNLNTKYNDQQLRAPATLPKGTGKGMTVACVVPENKIADCKTAGADHVGSMDLIDKIAGGFLEFDKMIATPDMMPKLAKLGRLLGPKGLMPNPKSGTVSIDPAKAVAELKGGGKVELRADKAGIVHVGIGKASFSRNDLAENLIATLKAIDANKPSGVKGNYWKSLYLTPTMGPSCQVDIIGLKKLAVNPDSIPEEEAKEYPEKTWKQKPVPA